MPLGQMHELIVLHRIADKGARKLRWKSIGNGSKVERLQRLNPEGLCSSNRGIRGCGPSPSPRGETIFSLLELRSNLVFVGVLLFNSKLCKAEWEKRPSCLEAKL